jgi:hypothetical protein
MRDEGQGGLIKIPALSISGWAMHLSGRSKAARLERFFLTAYPLLLDSSLITFNF